MTREDDEAADADGDSEELNLEALFESVSEASDSEEADGSGAEAPSDGSMVFDGADSEAASSDSQDEPEERGRFDEFLDRVGGAEGGSGASVEGQDINDLLERMGKGGSEPSKPGRNIDVDSFMANKGAGAGGESSDSGTDTEQFEMTAMEGLSGASDVLFAADRGGGLEPDICQSFFATYPPDEQNVLLVTLRQAAEDRLQAFNAGGTGPPENIAIISTDEVSQSAAEDSDDFSAAGRSDIIYKSVDDPGNLTRLGITISGVLNSWEENEHHTLVCFDSLSMLLQYADLQRVFRFIHVLQGRLSNVDATTHYHLNPEAHESQTEATLRSLFDGVISVTDGGELVYQ